jgi:CRISPR-associated endonuclease/helicase Cas3
MIIMNNEWEIPNKKLSHEDKCLAVHIEEVESFLKKFLNFYEFPEKYYKIAEHLARYHDYGKLHKTWFLGSKEGHSHLSLKWLLENNKVLSLNEDKLFFILLYFILKHHSSLLKTSESKTIEIKGNKISLQSVVDYCRDIIKKLNFEEKIDLVDVFGLFKIADVCSAENNFVEFKNPEIDEEKVKRVFGKPVDIERFLEQKNLSYLPDIGLLRAYTGWGKTDSSLLFFKNKNVKKIFYLFPTITAINKFYSKLYSVFHNEVSKYFYLYDTEIKEDLEKIQTLFFVENFTNPYIITTIDQFLLSFIQVGKYYRKRVMFRNSGIVMDEVHLLNPLMLNLLLYFIKKFRDSYNMKILFMSATLPKALEELLKKELQLSTNSLLDISKEYKTKRRIMWRYIDKDIENYLEKAVNLLRNGKRVLIIVNTVEKAINLGEKLEKEFKLKINKDFLILHARFMYKHRKEKEELIEKLRNKPHILIATQVCEVSLDISYDFLFTELASLPALIQRFGRVNRYKERIEDLNTFIFNVRTNDKKKYPYTEVEIESAKKVIIDLESNKLKNELMILENMDRILTYESLMKELDEAKKEVKIDVWENLLEFFYSFNIDTEEMSRFLEYRDSFTTLIIPSPDCIMDETIKKEIENLFLKNFSKLNFEERKRLIAEFKEFSVPIPIYWLKGREANKRVFPIVYFDDKVYDKNLGFKSFKGEIL